MIYLKLLWTFFKIGAFTFGGGYAMLPLIQAETLANGWLTEEEIVNFIAVSESTPGPFAINMATYVGSETAGVFGAVCATFGVVLPSFVVILIVARCYQKFQSHPLVKGALSGLKPAVIGLIASAFLSVAVSALFAQGVSLAALCSVPFFIALGIFVLSAVLAFCKVHPIFIICIAAALGVAGGYAQEWLAV